MTPIKVQKGSGINDAVCGMFVVLTGRILSRDMQKMHNCILIYPSDNKEGQEHKTAVSSSVTEQSQRSEQIRSPLVP